MKKSYNISAGKIFLSVSVFVAGFVFAMPVSYADFQPACPFSPKSGRTIVHFEDEVLSGGVRSDAGEDRARFTKSVNLPAGTYNVSLQSFDGGDGSERGDQLNEKYYLQLKTGTYGNISLVARTNNTNELPDHVSTPVWSGLVNSALVLSKSVNVITAQHATFPDNSSPNSVNVGCAAFDLLTEQEDDDDDLSVSCSVNPSIVNIGDSVNWTVSASGGNGVYSYSWSGSDSLSGNGGSIVKAYSSAGTKTGTVTVVSGSKSAIKTCSVVVKQIIIDDDLSVSCSANPSRANENEDITWRAFVSGGNGIFDYDWDGTDGLNGNSRIVTWSYDDAGTKRATVTVTSDNKVAIASCTARIDEEDEDDDLFVSCYASPGSTQVGKRMTWFARVSGGDGDYDYDWSGTEGLNSSNRSPSMTYDYAGSKRATVIVTDGDGQRDSASCNVNINSVLSFNQEYQPPLASAVYLSQVPYTGVADNIKLYAFIGMLAFFSAWIAYVVIARKKEVGELN